MILRLYSVGFVVVDFDGSIAMLEGLEVRFCRRYCLRRCCGGFLGRWIQGGTPLLWKDFRVPLLKDDASLDVALETLTGGCYAYLPVIEGEALDVVPEIMSVERGREGLSDEEDLQSVYEGELVCVLEAVVTGMDVLFPVSSFDVSLLLPVEPERI